MRDGGRLYALRRPKFMYLAFLLIYKSTYSSNDRNLKWIKDFQLVVGSIIRIQLTSFSKYLVVLFLLSSQTYVA